MFIGFDLGGTTGIAVLDCNGDRVYSTVWSLGKRTRQSLCKFQSNLYDIFAKYPPSVIAYERVMQWHRSRAAAVAYGGYEGILWAISHELDLPLVPVNVSTIKKYAQVPTHDKDHMEAAAYRVFKYVTYDDNEADALFIALIGKDIKETNIASATLP